MTAAKTADAQIRSFDVAKCDIASENARYGREVAGVAELAANITKYGLLQPLVGYELKGRVKIVAGARRLTALKRAGIKQVLVSIRDKKEAAALSVVENDQRKNMHPAEEAKAWAKMVAHGDDVTAIANAFGHTADFVKQRIALAGLHPPILEALASNKITLAIAEIYASAPVERQAALFRRHGLKPSLFRLREELTKGRLQADDRLALFVGRDAYLAAGGGIERDLFARSKTLDEDGWQSGDDDACEEYWLDRALAEKLAAAKIQEAVAKLKTEGWGFVEHGEQFPFREYHQGPNCKTDAAKKKAGAFLELTKDGAIKTTRHLLKGASKNSGYGVTLKSSRTKPIGAKAGPAKKQPPMTNTAHETATRVVSRVLGRAMIANPRVALVAITAQFARRRWGWKDGAGWHNQDVLDIQLNSDFARERGRKRAPLSFTDDKAVEVDERYWEAQLRPNVARLEDELKSWSDPKLMKLFGYLVGHRVHVIEEGPKDAANHKPRRARLQMLSRMVTLDVAPHWTPTKEWLLGLSKETLDKTARELGVVPQAQKGKTAAAVALVAKDKLWVPALIHELAGGAGSTIPLKPKAKAAPKKKRAA